MKILNGYTVKMNFYDDGKVSWEIFTDGQLINFGTSNNERLAKRMIKATFKPLDNDEDQME